MNSQKDIEQGIKAMISNNPDVQKSLFNSIKGGENVNSLHDAYNKISTEVTTAQTRDQNGQAPFDNNQFFPNLINRIMFQVIPEVRTLTSVFDKYGAMGMIDSGDGYEALGNNPRDAKLHDLGKFIPEASDKMAFNNVFYTTNYHAVTTTWFFAKAISTATVTVASLSNILAKIVKTLSDEIDLVKTYLEPKLLKAVVKNEITIASGDPQEILKSVWKEVSTWYYPSTEHNISKTGIKQSDGTLFKSLNTSRMKNIGLIVNGEFLTVWNTEIRANAYNQQFINQEHWGAVDMIGIEFAQPAQASVISSTLAKAFDAEENTLYAIDLDAYLTFIQAQGRTNQVWIQGQVSQAIYERGAVHLIEFMNGARFKYSPLTTRKTNVAVVDNSTTQPIYTKVVT